MPDAATRARRFKHLLWRSLLLPIVLLVATALVFIWAATRTLAQAKLVALSDAIIERATNCLQLAVDMETGIRGYQVTGSREFLQPYETAQSAIADQFGALDRMVAEPAQRERLAAMVAAHQAWAGLGKHLIAQREQGRGVNDSATNLHGKELFDTFRASVGRFLAAEERLKQDRAAEFDSANRRTLSGGLAILVAIGVGLGLYTRRQLHAVAGMFHASEAAALQEAGNARAAAERLRTAHDQLEQRVQERTRELKQALAKAQEVDRLKSQFLASMSHELRTPLNSIIGFTEIVLSGMPGQLNSEQATQLGFVRGSANHLLNLINDLLDLARIESGRVEPSWEDISPLEVLEEAVNTLRPLAERKGLDLHTDFQVPARMRTDRKMFYQVLLNLLGNAIKFTSRGAVHLISHTSGASLVTSIRDTGIGIKSEQMPLLFEAFRQIESSAQRRYEGTGLGLYLCRRITDLLGGTIRGDSEFGHGSTFTFTLPLAPP